MKKVMATLLAMTMAVGMFAACSSTPSSQSTGSSESVQSVSETGSTEKEVLEFYHGYFHEKEAWAPAAVMREIYDEFAQKYATGNVEFKPIPVENLSEIVSNKVAGGEFPDMVDMAGVPVPQAALAQGLVYDMKPYVDAEGIQNQLGINYTQNDVDGALYTVHDQLLTIGYWYNTKLFNDAGAAMPDTWKTWDDFAASMDTIRSYGAANGIYAYGVSQDSTRMFNAALGMTEEGRELLAGPLTVDGVNSDVFANAAKMIATINQENGSENTSGSTNDFAADFNDEKSAVFINGVWAAGGFSTNDNIQPSVYPGNVAISSAGGGLTIASGMSEEKTQLALEFIKYMTSAEVQQRILLEVGANPCNTDLDIQALAESSDDATTKLLAAACAQANNAETIVPTLDSVWGNDVHTIIGTKLQECAVASADIDAKVAELQNELIAILS